MSGFECDIFVSYRQNDNKYDGWVTEFVKNLNRELEATLKERVTTYFDENKYDGLLETDDVNKSLSNKLRALIFIPILSQTYCDSGCYAWKSEFVEFMRMARQDSIGKDVVLRNGNVASRILPIRIHDLDYDDLNLFEGELGSPLRAIDFYFKEAGVNRPLKPDDNEERNLSKTKYRNQINKVANSIKEILISIKNPTRLSLPPSEFSSELYPASKSIAVLPFVNMSSDPEQIYFSDGIAEEIINTLVHIPDLKVAGRTSAFSFRDRNEDLRSIGEKLNVNTILEGSVRKSGVRIRISVQLIETSTGFHLWSETFDRELNDVFIIQDEIAKAVVGKLQITLSGKEIIRRERLQTNNVEAYQLYLKGMSLFYRRGLYMFDGLKCFEEALNIDPEYALALAGLADSYTMLCFHSYISPEEALPKAKIAANRALLEGSELAEVHCSIATIALLFERNWDEARTEYLKALELNPYYLQALTWFAMFYHRSVWSDHNEAVRYVNIAIDHDPLSAYAQAVYCYLISGTSLLEEAIKAGIKSTEYDPDSFLGWNNLGAAFWLDGKIDSAISSYKHAMDISGRHNWPLIGLLALLSEGSDKSVHQEAEFLYKELLTKAKLGYVSPTILAIASAAVGNSEDAIRYFKLALERHDPVITMYFTSRADNKPFLSIPEISATINNLKFPK